METDVSCPSRKPYPSDVSDEEWSLVAPYLTLMSEEAPRLQAAGVVQRFALRHPLRHRLARDPERFSTLVDGLPAGAAPGCFEALAQDLRAVLRLPAGRKEELTAAIIDSRTLRSTPESGWSKTMSDMLRPSRASMSWLSSDTCSNTLRSA